MGEYANFNGHQVKIGTCESMYYLRHEQRYAVQPLEGNVDPVKDAAEIRFRFPFPDEDGTEPGAFENYNRGLAIDGMKAPEGVTHYTVQFVAQAGYNVCLPCPESLPAGVNGRIEFSGATIHRNGFPGAVMLCAHRQLADGQIVPVFKCGGCGALWRVEEAHEIEAAMVAVRCMADKSTSPSAAAFFHKIADRLAG